MARYCFYCNRELNTGERCNCRVAEERRAEQAATARTDETKREANASAYASQDADTTGSGETGSKREAKQAKRKAERAHRKAEHARAKQRAQRERVYTRQEHASGKRARTSGFSLKASLLSIGRNILMAFRKPTDFIQEVCYKSAVTVIVMQLLEAYMIAFTLLRVLNMSNIGNLIAYNRNGASAPLSLPSQWMIFLKLFMLALVLAAVRILINNLVLRFVGRTRMKLWETTKLMTAGTIYYCIFLLFGVALSAGSGLQTLFILIAGYGVRVIVDHIATRMRTGHSEDQMLRLTLLIFLITAMVLGSIVGVVTPNLSDFRVDVSGQIA